MIKYRHRNCAKEFTPATFAYVLPPAHAFDEMLRGAHEVINFSFGMTLLHEKDQYVKSIGRAYAERDLHRGKKSFQVYYIQIKEGRVHFVLRTHDTFLPLELRVSVDFEHGKSRLEDVEFFTLC